MRPRRIQQVYQHLRLLLIIQRYYARNPIADTDLVLLIVSSEFVDYTLCLRYSCPVLLDKQNYMSGNLPCAGSH